MGIIHDPLARGVLLLISFGTVAGAAVFLAIGFLPARLAAQFGIVRHLSSASRTVFTLCACPTSSLALIATSLPIHFITVAIVWCCAQSVAAV